MKKNPNLLEEEFLNGLAEKNDLEKALSVGLQGSWELGKEEKKQYLGQFRERVLKVLTLEQVEEKVVYPEIREALSDPKASQLIVNGKASQEAEERYRLEAKKCNISVLSLNSSELVGSIGLVVAASAAVERADIYVTKREDRLLQKGIPLPVIRGVGKKLCSRCYKKLTSLAPEEKDNYQVLSWWEQLLGEKCLCC